MTAVNDVTDYSVEDGVAVITIDFPPVNALGHAVRRGISAGLERAFIDPAISAVALLCAGRTFFVGADITEFGKPLASPVLREIAEQIERAEKPVVAAIHGTALGGGLEMALACHWRVAVRSAQLGLPEVKLGLLAGAGGTQRLPRLVGVEKALDMVVSGDPIGAREALEHGLIDAIVEDDLRGGTVSFAARIARQADALRRVRDMPSPSADREIFTRFRQARADRLHGFEAPEASIRCIEAAATQSFDDGMKTERRLFEQLMSGVQSAAQRYAFFAERDAAKVPGLPKAIAARPIASAVLLDDTPAEGLIQRLSAAGIKTMSVTQWEASQPGPGVAPDLVLDLATTGDAWPPKRHCSVIATCRSDAENIPAGLEGATVPIRLRPSARTPLLIELLRTSALADDVLATMLLLAKKLGLTPVVTQRGDVLIGQRMLARLAQEVERCVADGASPSALVEVASGFGLTVDRPAAADRARGAMGAAEMLDRLIVPLINEGARLLEEGVAARASDIDVACVKSGMWKVYRGGPMFHAGQIGLPDVISALRRYERQWGAGYRPAPLLDRLAQTSQALHQFQGAGNG